MFQHKLPRYRRLVPTCVAYYAASSLDGRIAGPGDDLTFLQTLTGAENDSELFVADVDSLIMGAETWRFLVAHGRWPYGDKPAWVVTHANALEDLDGATAIERFSGDLAELVRLIGDRGCQRTWLLGGGSLAGQLLDADLIDELVLTVAPTFVGEGPTLADGVFPLRRFRLTELGRFGDEGVRLRYERSR